MARDSRRGFEGWLFIVTCARWGGLQGRVGAEVARRRGVGRWSSGAYAGLSRGVKVEVEGRRIRRVDDEASDDEPAVGAVDLDCHYGASPSGSALGGGPCLRSRRWRGGLRSSAASFARTSRVDGCSFVPLLRPLSGAGGGAQGGGFRRRDELVGSVLLVPLALPGPNRASVYRVDYSRLSTSRSSPTIRRRRALFVVSRRTPALFATLSFAPARLPLSPLLSSDRG